MSSSLSKIHVTNSTGLSLNERFTAISSQPRVPTNTVNARRSRSRSRSIQRSVPAVAVERVSSRANQRLLAQLQRKHKMQAALKLKRRSMRTVGGTARGNGANGRIRRGSVKAFRVGANGKPIKANSLTNIATMKADREMLNTRRPLRRSNSSGNIANRLGPRRPMTGGAAQRVARRNIERQRGGRRNSIGGNGRSVAQNNRGRSRSSSRTRTQHFPTANGRNRSRTRNPDNLNTKVRGRSRSRNRNDNIAQISNNRRGRSRSRSRGRGGVIDKSSLPIKARLGVRPGMQNVRAGGNRGGGQNNRRGNDNRIHNVSLTRRGVQTGRVQKRRNSTNQNVARAAGNDNNGRNRMRSRSAVRNGNVGAGAAGRSRSRSRTRKGQVGQQKQQGLGQARQQQQQGLGQARQQQQQSLGQARQQQQRNNRAPRGRSQQRRGGNNNGPRGGGRQNNNNNGKAQTQQRRGRSRSRTGRGASGPRNQGNKSAAKTTVNRDDLDKELDQYMATTKTEHDMDYLLKN